jgi:hypothetical protein
MSAIAVYGCKQAPGVTTFALALVAVLDAQGGAILVEADPQGGDIAAMSGRPPAPGLMSLAAAGRHGSVVDLVDHVQPLPAGGTALLAPSDPVQVSAALAAIGDELVRRSRGSSTHVVLDRGRGEPLRDAETSILVCHPTVAGVEQARVRRESFALAGIDIILATSSSGPYRPDEIAGALGCPVLGAIPHDPRAASSLVDVGTVRGLRRSPLLRMASSSAEALAGLGSQESVRR